MSDELLRQRTPPILVSLSSDEENNRPPPLLVVAAHDDSPLSGHTPGYDQKEATEKRRAARRERDQRNWRRRSDDDRFSGDKGDRLNSDSGILFRRVSPGSTQFTTGQTRRRVNKSAGVRVKFRFGQQGSGLPISDPCSARVKFASVQSQSTGLGLVKPRQRKSTGQSQSTKVSGSTPGQQQSTPGQLEEPVTFSKLGNGWNRRTHGNSSN
ncbi:hypothetical protein HanHA89_Chr02g0048731 [Helianthus annuus]|nr:hypothetical protein HanHA89_Chr02g0048731 [Helianthus annuus]